MLSACPPPMTKEFLEHHYVQLGKSCKQIAKEWDWGISGSTVATRVRKFGLTRTHHKWLVGEINSLYFNYLKRLARKRRRKKQEDLEFHLDPKFLWNLFLEQNGRCALSGRRIKLDKNWSEGVGIATASLDRIDSTKGYIEGNVQWVHKQFNKLKNNFDEKTLLVMCQDILETHQAKIRREADKNRSS